MATKKAAESTLYHVSPKGFWKTLRAALVVNPEISSGLPLPTEHRWPPPGSRPEAYSTPATKASDPAENPYWKRDVRRAHPQLSVVTQPELATLLIAHSAEQSGPPATTTDTDLTSAIGAITSTAKVYSEHRLPPSLPIPHKPWRPALSPNAPHMEHTYWTMSLYH